MLLRANGRLVPIYRIEEFTAPEEGVDVVIIPGVWIEYPPHQYKKNCSWIKPLVAATDHDTRVFLYSYQLETDGSSLWNQLLAQGSRLLDELDKIRVNKGDNKRPLVFLCHSLGGLIVKKALTISNEKMRSYDYVTSGIIFLGTPHINNADSTKWDNMKLIMKASRRDISKQNMTDIEMNNIIVACRQFDDLHLTIPILSIHDGLETKVHENLLSAIRSKGGKTMLLVPEPLARISARYESCFCATKNHAELCNVEVGSPLYDRITEFFKDIFSHGPFNVRVVTNNGGLVPNMEQLYLKPSGGSDQAEIGTHIDFPNTYNPISQPSEPELGTTNSASEESEDYATEGTDLVRLPVIHLASMTRNPRYFIRQGVLEKIDDFFTRPNLPPESDASITSQELPRTYALTGMGGVGKSDTAIEYVSTRKDAFDAVFWIFADTNRKLATQMGDICSLLQLVEDGGITDENAAREAVYQWLAEPYGYRIRNGQPEKARCKWLLVLDNADDPDTLYKWLPERGPGCVLVTSRYPFVKEASHRLDNGQELEPLTTEQASQMLRDRAHITSQDPAILSSSERIAAQLGGLPLAIAQMSGVIRTHHLSLQNFEDWYAEDAAELHALHAHDGSMAYPYTIATAWALEKLSPQATALLQVISILDPDRISEDLLMEGAKDVKLRDYPIKKTTYFNARAELIHDALITRNMAANELRIHRVIQDVARHRLTESRSPEVLAAAFHLLSKVWPFVSGTDPTRNQSWRVPVADQYTAHICRIGDLFSALIQEQKFAMTSIGGSVFCSYGWYAVERGIRDHIVAYSELAIAILTSATRANSEEEERVTHWLGEAHHNLSLGALETNSGDGMKDVHAWLDILQERKDKFNFAKDECVFATAYNQLAICHMHNGDVKTAIENFVKARTAFRTASDAPPLADTWPSINLALLYALQGNSKDAEEVLQPTLEEHEKALGPDDATTTESGHIWRAMGNIRRLQQNSAEALQFYTRALQNMTATLGSLHFFTGDCHYSIGLLSMAQQDYLKAREHFDNAINAFKAGTERRAQCARAIWKKSTLLHILGEDAESQILEKSALHLRREILPNDRRTLADLSEEDWGQPILYWSR